MLNNPIRYNDPTGHKEDDCYGVDDCKAQGIKDDIEKMYKVKVEGRWKEKEIASLRSMFGKAATALGGIDILNKTILKAAQKWDTNATHITYQRVATDGYLQNKPNSAAAAWCGGNKTNCSPNTIIISDKTFSACYQTNSCSKPEINPAYTRPNNWSVDQGSQFTMAHDLGHVLHDASPGALATYNSLWGKPGDDGKEAFANNIARDIITPGQSQFGNWQYINYFK